MPAAPISRIALDFFSFRGKPDGNQPLIDFSKKLECVCIDVVESGKMTKDLAVCIHGEKVAPEHYLTTDKFMAALREELERRM